MTRCTVYFIDDDSWIFSFDPDHTLASSPGSSQILSRSRGEKSGEGLGAKLRHGPEMVDSVCTNRVHVTIDCKPP